LKTGKAGSEGKKQKRGLFQAYSGKKSKTGENSIPYLGIQEVK
jgi:hypothetical protein